MSKSLQEERAHSQEVLAYIESTLTSLRYGTLTLTIHDGRVVQIDRTEKLRLAGAPVGERRS